MGRRGRPPHPDILTPREWEVLALLREGLSDQAIADRLGVSLDGAKYHVREILSKLCLSSRQEAAAWDGREGAARQVSRLWAAPVLAKASLMAGAAAAIAGLVVLGAAALVSIGESQDPGAGAATPQARAALMLTGRQLRGPIAAAEVQRVTLEEAHDILIGDGFQVMNLSDVLAIQNQEIWLVRLTGEFQKWDDYGTGRAIVGSGWIPDRQTRGCIRAAAIVTDRLEAAYTIPGPTVPAPACRPGAPASMDTAIAAAGQASYRIIGVRTLSDAKAELTDGGRVWQIGLNGFLIDPGMPNSPPGCRKLVVRLDASSLRVLESDLAADDSCPDPPRYSMSREDVESIARAQVEGKWPLATIERIDVDRLRGTDIGALALRQELFFYVSDLEPLTLSVPPPQSPVWRVTMRGLPLYPRYKADVCGVLSVFVDDTTQKPLLWTFRVIGSADCDLPFPG